MDIGIVTILIFVTLIVLLAAGVPFAFAIGGTALLYTVLLWGVKGLGIVSLQTIGTMLSTVLLAIPLFILMANFLQRSGVADDLYQLMYTSLGRIRGGLAVGTVIICTLFAAMAGVSGAATVSMGLIALPSMLKRNYNKTIAIGCISAGGALGVLIPPSVSMVVLSVMMGISVGQLFAGGILSGLLLSTLFIIYIGLRSFLQPNIAPAIPIEERPPLRAVLLQLRSLLLPLFIIVAVLGSIFAGIATPTEAAAVGALGALISATIKRKMNWHLISESSTETLRLTTFIMWIIVSAMWFSAVYTRIGGPVFINDMIQNLGVDRWAVLIGMQIVLIIFGMFMDTSGIILITIPIFMPIIHMLDFNPVWFGILFMMNMEMGFLTPPFGINLFYLKAIAPEDVSMTDIYRSVVPFVFLQLTGLIIVMLIPQIALFLPELIFG